MTPADCLAAVNTSLPELAVERVELLGEGWTAWAFTSGAWVFRFPKNAVAIEEMQHGARVLQLLPSGLRTAVPRYQHWGHWRGAPFGVYRCLAGVPLSTAHLDAAGREAVAHELGSFLRELHAVRDPRESQDPPWADRCRSVLAAAQPFLRPRERSLGRVIAEHMAALLAEAAPSVLCHGDLLPEHLLVAPAPPALAGVLDFDAALHADPAWDFGVLVSGLGAEFAQSALATYGGGAALLERAQRYAQLVPLRDLVDAAQVGLQDEAGRALERLVRTFEGQVLRP